MGFSHQLRVPPGGMYFYAVETDSGDIVRFSERSSTALVSAVRSWLVDNGRPVPADLWAVCQDYMCPFLPKGFCPGSSGTTVLSAPELKKRAFPFLRGRVAIPGLIKDRLTVCVGCPKNDRNICTACTGLIAWALSSLGRSRIAMDDYAGVCKCDGLMVTVAVSLAEPPKLNTCPAECWRGVANG